MSLFFRRLSLAQTGSRLTTAGRRRPAVEVLEERCAPSSLSGFISGANSTEYSHVTVWLVGTTTSGQSVSLYTQAEGLSRESYSFSGLQPGVYRIIVNDAPSYSAEGAVVGTVNGKRDGTPSLPGGPSGVASISSIQLGANESGINYDFTGSFDLE